MRIVKDIRLYTVLFYLNIVLYVLIKYEPILYINILFGLMIIYRLTKFYKIYDLIFINLYRIFSVIIIYQTIQYIYSIDFNNYYYSIGKLINSILVIVFLSNSFWKYTWKR